MKNKILNLVFAAALIFSTATLFGACNEKPQIIIQTENETLSFVDSQTVEFVYGEKMFWQGGKDLKVYYNDQLFENTNSKDYQILNAGTYTLEFNNFSVTIIVNKAQQQITNISNLSKVYDGRPVDNPTFEKLGTPIKDCDVVFEYKKFGASDETYTNISPTDVGEYTVRITLSEEENYKGIAVKRNFVITKSEVDFSEIEIPTLSGIYSPLKTLADYPLPEGFLWVNSTQVPSLENTLGYDAIYSKGENFESINLKIKIELVKSEVALKITSTSDELNHKFGEAFKIPTWSASLENSDVKSLIEDYVFVLYSSDNISFDSTTPQNCGTYYAKIMLLENPYFEISESESLEFMIEKLEQTLSITKDLSKDFDGTPVKFSKENISCLNFENTQIEIKYFSGEQELLTPPTNAGTYKVEVVAKENENYLGAKAWREFSINKISASLSPEFESLNEKYLITYGSKLSEIKAEFLSENWNFAEDRIITNNVKETGTIKDFYFDADPTNYTRFYGEFNFEVVPASLSLQAKNLSLESEYNGSNYFIDLKNVFNVENPSLDLPFTFSTNSNIPFALNMDNRFSVNSSFTIFEGKELKLFEIFENSPKKIIKVNFNLTSQNFVLSEENKELIFEVTQILAKPNIVTTPSASSIKSGQSLSESIISGGEIQCLMFEDNVLSNKEVLGEWTFEDETLILAETGSVNITFTPNDTNIEPVKTTVMVEVVKEAYDKHNITTFEEFKLAIQNGESEIVVTASFDISENITLMNNLTINLQNATLTLNSEISISDNANLTLIGENNISKFINNEGIIIVNGTLTNCLANLCFVNNGNLEIKGEMQNYSIIENSMGQIYVFVDNWYFNGEKVGGLIYEGDVTLYYIDSAYAGIEGSEVVCQWYNINKFCTQTLK